MCGHCRCLTGRDSPSSAFSGGCVWDVAGGRLCAFASQPATPPAADTSSHHLLFPDRSKVLRMRLPSSFFIRAACPASFHHSVCTAAARCCCPRCSRVVVVLALFGVSAGGLGSNAACSTLFDRWCGCGCGGALLLLRRLRLRWMGSGGGG